MGIYNQQSDFWRKARWRVYRENPRTGCAILKIAMFHCQRVSQNWMITICFFNIAMENCLFIDGLPINSMVIFYGYVKYPESNSELISIPTTEMVKMGVSHIQTRPNDTCSV